MNVCLVKAAGFGPQGGFEGGSQPPHRGRKGNRLKFTGNVATEPQSKDMNVCLVKAAGFGPQGGFKGVPSQIFLGFFSQYLSIQ